MKIYVILILILLVACAKQADPIEPVVKEEPVVTASCADGVQNQGEAGVDCGGPCAVCETCSDGVQNQREAGIDCGGPCTACATCDDGIQNQGESGVDCGGVCKPCPVEKYEIYTEDFQALQDKMKPNIEAVFLRAALPTGLDIGESYVFALGLTNTMLEEETFMVDVAFREARDSSTNLIGDADPDTVMSWFDKNDWEEYTLGKYGQQPVPIGVTVGEQMGPGAPTESGTYYFKTTVTYKTKYNTKDYAEAEFNFRVK